MQPSSHDSMLPAADSGCLLIADVSGYTRYLHDTELEHAQDVLADLLGSVVTHLRSALRISKLEGDAVFAYALASEIDGSTLLDTVEQTYFAFRTRLRDVFQATTCQCNACRLIPSLDLKFVVHDGRFARHRPAGSEELTGSDVVIVHRLLKNDVKTFLGLDAYALFTEACLVALGMDPEVLGMKEHRERYEDVGEIRSHVEDLKSAWDRYEEQRQVFVAPAEAQLEFTATFPAPAAVVWDFCTSPHKRLLWQTDFTRIDESNPGGRRGPGTTNHCVHGRGAITEEILDWRPFHYFTLRMVAPMIGSLTQTFEFRPVDENSTTLHIRFGPIRGRQRLIWPLFRRNVAKGMQANSERLHRLLEEEVGEPTGMAAD